MKKYNIAVIFGGCSSEYDISLGSAGGVISHMDEERFTPVLIGISRKGDWYHFTGDVRQIAKDTWLDENCTPAALSPDRSRHELLVFHQNEIERIPLDGVLPVLHGKNGEDGTVQGLCELAGIPLAGCGVTASALCMDKERAHKLVSLSGIRVPSSFAITQGYDGEQVRKTAGKIGYPLFVKPVKAGSSHGIAKVAEEGELEPAIREAFCHDDCVVLEENIPGFEVGCAVVGREELFTGVIDEIELSRGFFDFAEKYNRSTARIHVPARIACEKAEELKEAAKIIFRTLGCSGFARVDMFLTPEGEIVFNEVNTIPGFTPHSRFPIMLKEAGMPFDALVTKIIEQAVEK